jgi:hypothetical protein
VCTNMIRLCKVVWAAAHRGCHARAVLANDARGHDRLCGSAMGCTCSQRTLHGMTIVRKPSISGCQHVWAAPTVTVTEQTAAAIEAYLHSRIRSIVASVKWRRTRLQAFGLERQVIAINLRRWLLQDAPSRYARGQY